MSKNYNVHVYKKDNEPIESLIKRFSRKVKEEKILLELKDKSYYKSPGQKKREARKRNKRRSEKEYSESDQNTLFFME
tara:strand:- start:219 stop:452 length:234 start_codon:yes stop_codon:yes gene_type:complete